MVGWAVIVTIGKKRHVDRLFVGDDIHKVEEAAISYLRKQVVAHKNLIDYDLELVTDIVPIK